MPPTVAIIGGGVAGMSAAHELVERGFSVRVFEKNPAVPGGKARSVAVPDSATEGHEPLPGEHGFRFFPGFYRHVTDTMRRIPFSGNRNGVFDNLVPSPKVMMARFGSAPIITLTRFPRSFSDVRTELHALANAHTGLTNEEKEFFAMRTWQLMTSCEERRVNDYERIAWWQFTQADRFGDAYRSLFVKGLTRTLVAARASEASTKTGGDIFIQLVFNMSNPRIDADRVLCGPTNDVWIDPWLDYLQGQGVDYRFGSTVERIDCDGERITGIHVTQDDGTSEHVTADYYLAAVPVERMAELLSDEMVKADATLRGITQLATSVAWMTGIQLYLNEEVVINQGHVIYSDTPWALTSISQLPFWRGFDVHKHGNGRVRSILSIDISDWDTEGLNGKVARECTKEEIRDEVWEQLKKSLEDDPDVDLHDGMIEDWYLDRDIIFEDSPEGSGEPLRAKAARHREATTQDNVTTEREVTTKSKATTQRKVTTRNEEPLLVNNVNTWMLRPEAATGIPNLFLAADYVRTFTDLATMEGANEAARRAVNGIIDASGTGAPLCKIWNLHEPVVLQPLRWLDRRRYRKGLPWTNELPLIFRILHTLFAWVHRFVARLNKSEGTASPSVGR